jgi:hypothetical protein
VVDDTLRDAARPEQERLARRLKSYEAAAREELTPEHAQDQVLGHADTFVYRTASVLVVVPKTASELDVLSALLAAHLSGVAVELAVEARAGSERFERLIPPEAAQFSSVDELEAIVFGRAFDRVRVLGPATGPAYEAQRALAEASPSVDAEPVHDSGYVELRRYVLEESRSVARHRHGNTSLFAASEHVAQERRG